MTPILRWASMCKIAGGCASSRNSHDAPGRKKPGSAARNLESERRAAERRRDEARKTKLLEVIAAS